MSPSNPYSVGADQVEACFRSGEKIEELIRTDEGVYFRVKVFPLFDGEGEISRVLKVASDVTQNFRIKEEADRINRLASLGELSAGVAHEINNPNSLTLLNTPIARDAIEEILPILDERFENEGEFNWGGLPYSRMREELPQMIDEMHDGARRIQKIVEDLKNFVRRDEIIELEEIDLNASVETGLRLIRGLVNDSTDNFVCDLQKDLPPVSGNRVQLEQVVVNLVQNACLALPDQDRSLTIRTTISDDNQNVLLVVSDEGHGIEPENLKRITDPFFTTRRNEGGTGLGLSVSNRIVRDMGGQMFFDSTPGAGTTVTVRFPISK